MNRYAIQHRPDSEYAYALDERTIRIVLKVQRGEQLKELMLLWNTKYDFTKRRNTAWMQKGGSCDMFDYYYADIELSDVRFAYIFSFRVRDTYYYFSEEGLTEEYDFKHSYYTFFQFPYINPADVVKTVPWAKDAVFYQIFIDRFKRGDAGKDGGYITQEWNEIPQSKSYAGGDIKGITEKLDCLADMGVTALYLTPVFKAPSNHKYNITSYLEVDPMFGTNDDLKELIGATHARGMKLMIDTVFNHCDVSCEKFQDVMKKGRASRYYDWFIIHGDVPTAQPCNYEIFADCVYMPKWNTSNPEVREYFLSIALTYLEWGFDGLRLDVADEVSHTFWRELRAEVKAKYPEALLLGEVWHENTMFLHGDEFDGVMNYKLQKVFVDYFALRTADAREAAARINRIWYKNTRQANEMMLNFLDNHDTPRFLRLCGEDVQPLMKALAALYFAVGMPCVTYGTELPLTGDGDPDCRRTYDWGKTPALRDCMKALAEMRRELPRGELRAHDENGALVLVRENAAERVAAYFGGRPNIGGRVLYQNGDVTIIKENT